jgi:filamentous hemagglutinin
VATSRVNGISTRPVVAAEDGGLVNLASDARTTHILEGDGTGGGHFWPGAAGKTPFPESWSGGQIMHAVSDIATDPAAWENAVQQGSRTVLVGARGGVEIRVIVDSNGEIITGYPINLPRNP